MPYIMEIVNDKTAWRLRVTLNDASEKYARNLLPKGLGSWEVSEVARYSELSKST
jgi:hypothetical protein